MDGFRPEGSQPQGFQQQGFQQPGFQQQGFQQPGFQPQGYQQPGFQPPNYGAPQGMAPIITLKEWIITMLILCVPLVNFVMIFVWAFSSGTNPSKANLFKAQLIFAVVVIVLWFLFFGAFFATLMGSGVLDSLN